MSEEDYAIGIDIGGTKIIIALVDNEGKILQQKVFPTNPAQGAPAIIDHVINEVKTLLASHPNSPAAIGVGMAGQILFDGTVKFAPNLGWRQVAIKSLLAQTFHLPTFVMNDVRAAAWGEWKHGAGKRFDDVVCLMIGTGIGGGVIIGGRMMAGANNGAGELGHFPVQMNGLPCTCGNFGCLETIAAGWGIAKLGGKASAKEVLELARQSDPAAAEIIENAIDAIVAACAGYANIFNPSRLVIGGGLGLALPGLIGRIDQGVKAKALEVASEKLEIVPASLLQGAVAIGAATFASSQLARRV